MDDEDPMPRGDAATVPSPLLDAIQRVIEGLRDGSLQHTDLEAAVSGLTALPPAAVPAAGAAVAELVLLSRHRSGGVPAWEHREADLTRLCATDGLERLFVLHPDGYVREAALRMLSGPARTAFEIAAIAYRLNDWAFPVRVSARSAALRIFPETEAGLVVEALFFLLDRMSEWQRWRAEQEDNERILNELMARPDVCARFAERLCAARTGRMGKLLRHAVRWPGLDPFLPELARCAFLPSVRAYALRFLIEERATWPEGTRWEWVDKTYGLTHRVRVIGERRFVRTSDLKTLIVQGAQDRSAIVRRVAGDALVQHRSGLDDAMLALVRKLADDKSPSVRERATFILKERAAR
ncbi:hypothetical protein [Methylobacterium sp. AMS5]|uniref:hypothetical protein n=1 Tax=Methylobacterium sp. AMS5 TaxID=925818 RepID=UPI001187463A|nr:hypothetical protein [Methylobacterium sp. AMS5]